jgi:iron complex outermembrane receptor protein
MKKKVKLFFVAIIIFFPIEMSGQNEIVIKGKVTDQTGNPLVDANISIINESYGSSTDKDGDFIFRLPDNYAGREVVLEARYVGFVTQSVTIKLIPGNNLYDFRMERDMLSIKPIIVTAQRREENLQNVPISVTALDNKDIKSYGLNRVFDLQNAIPNFFFGDGGFNYSAPSSIRGISGSSRASGVEARTNYYIDDVYMGRSVAVNQDLFDLERIEILKGPQGTLFGKNTVSGVINIAARKPFNGWEGTVNIDAGSFNYLNSNIIINAPLIDNKLFTRFSGKIMRTDGFVTNLYNNKDYNEQNILNGRLQLRYLPSPNFDIIMSLNVLRDRRPRRIVGIALDGPGYDAAPGPREVSHNLNEFENRDIFGGAHQKHGLSINTKTKMLISHRNLD